METSWVQEKGLVGRLENETIVEGGEDFSPQDSYCYHEARAPVLQWTVPFGDRRTINQFVHQLTSIRFPTVVLLSEEGSSTIVSCRTRDTLFFSARVLVFFSRG